MGVTKELKGQWGKRKHAYLSSFFRVHEEWEIFVVMTSRFVVYTRYFVSRDSWLMIWMRLSLSIHIFCSIFKTYSSRLMFTALPSLVCPEALVKYGCLKIPQEALVLLRKSLSWFWSSFCLICIEASSLSTYGESSRVSYSLLHQYFDVEGTEVDYFFHFRKSLQCTLWMDRIQL